MRTFNAIINPSQAAILAVGAAQRRVLPKSSTTAPADGGGEYRVGTVMSATLSCDHRVVDGATMARFSNLWKDYIENPLKLVADLK